ncbi:MAG: PCMD domain-containing protein [Bacteroidales bacterium]|jgi:hypothetical protein|nr:PCMD domain-containing protein [Bacteroidales bacterium]
MEIQRFKNIYRAAIFGMLVSLGSCISEYHFGKYDQAKILSLSVENQVGSINIDHEALMITLLIDESADIQNLKINTLEVSSFASVIPAQGDIVDFSNPVSFTVVAENGNSQVYTVIAKRSQAEIQLNNANFQDWYEVTSGSKKYYEPGKSKEETLWGTGNPGVVTLGAPNVNPSGSAENVFALLKTVELALGKLLGQGIGAGSMFTGFFKLNLSNPISSAKFGVPYSARPNAFSIKYKYSPGPIVKDGKLNILPNAKDSCDIGIILTDRSSEPYKQVAVAWFRSGENITEWKTITLDFKYGAISSPASYERPKDVYILDNGKERLVPVVYGTGNEKPTHISVVFASSHRGDFFEGAPGSELYVDDLELIY